MAVNCVGGGEGRPKRLYVEVRSRAPATGSVEFLGAGWVVKSSGHGREALAEAGDRGIELKKKKKLFRKKRNSGT